jgi:hypothetical protein
MLISSGTSWVFSLDSRRKWSYERHVYIHLPFAVVLFLSGVSNSILCSGAMIQARKSLVEVPAEMSNRKLPACKVLPTRPPSVSRWARQCGILYISQTYRRSRLIVMIAVSTRTLCFAFSLVYSQTLLMWTIVHTHTHTHIYILWRVWSDTSDGCGADCRQLWPR